MKRSAVLLLASSALVLGGALPAAAQTATVPDIADEVRDDGVHVDPGFSVAVDEAALERTVERAPAPVYVVLLPEDQAPDDGAAREVAAQVGDAAGLLDAVVLVVTDEPFAYALQGPQSRLDAPSARQAATSGLPEGQIDPGIVNSLVVTFVDELDAQAAGAGPVPGGGTGSGSGSTGSSSALPLLLGLGVLGGGAYAVSRARSARSGRREHATSMQDNRADVESLYGRLGSDVQTLAPGDDAVARQALADAAERYNAAGALMARASTDGEWAAARRTAVEGLTAARVVRERLGLDPGPEIPMPEQDQAPRLEQAGTVQVGEQQFEGSPRYVPGRPHYYEGGYYGGRVVPGGWYATPFWQTMLLTSVLGGGRRRSVGYGGGVFGGGLGGGYGGSRRPASRRGGGFMGGGGRGRGGFGGGRGGGGGFGGGFGGGRGGGGGFGGGRGGGGRW